MTVNQISKKSHVLRGDRNHYFTIYYNVKSDECEYEEFIGNGYILIPDDDIITIGNIYHRTSAKVLQNMINDRVRSD